MPDDLESNDQSRSAMNIALTLLAAAADPAATKRRLGELDRATKAASDAAGKIRDAGAEAERIVAAAQRQADELTAIWRARLDAAAVAEAALVEREQHMKAEREAGARFRRHVLRASGITINEKMQTLPDFDELYSMMFPADPHMPDDPSAAVVFTDPNADRHGLPFRGDLTREVA